MKRWRKMGVVGVDSGSLWIGDPVYLYDGSLKERFPRGWDDLVEATPDAVTVPITFANGLEGLAVLLADFGGDGVFPVEVRRDKEGVTEVRVRFR
jgi:hypothetical protein